MFQCRQNFNPHSPCGERLTTIKHSIDAPPYFNPHSPCGERHAVHPFSVSGSIFQSTLPLRGATRQAWQTSPSNGNFNPHSPCGERPKRSARRSSTCNFNPHSPCGERLNSAAPLLKPDLFQSTLPLRGATRMDELCRDTIKFQSTLPLRGATNGDRGKTNAEVFQSTLPLRGATRHSLNAVV